MTADERSVLQQLDRIVRSEQVRAQILPIVERVRAELTRKPRRVDGMGANRADIVR
jgi:hypothetical protein